MKSRGFSLTELMVVMGMMTILLSIGGLSLAALRVRSHIDLTAADVKTELARAQARRLNGIESGVYFEANRFVYFEGPAYVEGAPGNYETTLPSSMTFSSITFPANTLRFEAVTGNPEAFADPFEVVITDASGLSKTVSVNRWGVVEVE